MNKSTTPENATNSPNFPLAGLARDGWSTEDRATATCYCGTVQLSFPTRGPGLGARFICHCTDCRKITASMFATNLTVADSHLVHERGRDKLSTFGQSATINPPHHDRTMTNYFCSACGTLMYRIGSGWPGYSILRLGTVDDFSLHETKLRPQVEQFIECRVGWLDGMKCGEDGEGGAVVEVEQAVGQFGKFQKSAVKQKDWRTGGIKSTL